MLHIIRALYENVLHEGTISWDEALKTALALLLQVTCCAWAGDLARSAYYKGERYLAFEHVDIKVYVLKDGDGSGAMSQWSYRYAILKGTSKLSLIYICISRNMLTSWTGTV